MTGWRGARAALGLTLGLALAAAAQPAPGPEAHGPGGGRGGHEGMGEVAFSPRMLHELHLSADQEKKLKDIHLAAEKKKIQLHGEKATLELDLKNTFSTYPVNKSEALRLAEKIADVDKRMTMHRVETMTQVLGNLNADQFAKLQDLQEERMEKRRAWREEWWKDRGGRRGGKDEGKGPNPPDGD
jgi:Spy/CpxP family protein refolding chaperone